MIRKNAVPVWIKFNNDYCVSCGDYFKDGEKILSSLYCLKCGQQKEKELKLRSGKAPSWTEFRKVCISCAQPHNKDDELLFGIYCKKCGTKWIRARDVRNKNQLRKARNIPEVGVNVIEVTEKFTQTTLDNYLLPTTG